MLYEQDSDAGYSLKHQLCLFWHSSNRELLKAFIRFSLPVLAVINILKIK